jgi:signal transduction histidine kinase
MPLAVFVASSAGSPYLEALARAGLDTQAAGNIEQALAACRQTPPDLIVALEGPLLDAVEACRTLKASTSGSGCVVLLVGPGDDEARHLSGLDAGADACLRRSAHPETVATQALALLRGRAAAQRAHQDDVREKEEQLQLEIDRTQSQSRATQAKYTTLYSAVREGFAHYRAVLDATGALVDLLVVDVNPPGAALTGVPPDAQIGRTWRQVWPDLDESIFEVYQRVAHSGEAAHFDHEDPPTGRCYDVAVSLVAPGEFAVSFYDVTARKAAEAALRRANDELRESGRRKDEFIAILSHELRNPLAPIRMALPLLMRDRQSESGTRALGVIDRQVTVLTRLLDDLLDVSRISRGKLDIRPQRTSLGAIIKAAVEASSPLIMAGRHDLRLLIPDDPVWIRADLARLTQVVTNLLHNSVICTPPGGRIELEAGREGDRAVVRVRDNGIGIPTQALPDPFEMFRQVKRADQPQGGLGIGLALSRRLTELHGGTIEAHSDGVGRGAEFVIRLPLVDTAAAPILRSTAPPRNHRLLKVLIVDDNEDLIEMLSAIVTDLGHEVRKALDGGSAVDAAASYHPDLVLLDLGLPVLSGIDVARELRSRPETSRVCLVAITGWGAPEDRARTREAGFNHHLTKPVDPEELIQVIAQCA